jgi:hypothetical protein
MGIITTIKKSKVILDKLKKAGKEPDKVTKKVYSGEKGSPFKNVDDLGNPPSFRNIKEKPGTEIKKLKEIGPKISKEFKKQDKQKPLRDLQMGGSKYGFRGGGIAQRGFGRAFMKGGKVR